MNIQDEILETLKKHAALPEKDQKYINPHFLAELNGLLFDFFKIEDDDVDAWTDNMWGW